LAIIFLFDLNLTANKEKKGKGEREEKGGGKRERRPDPCASVVRPRTMLSLGGGKKKKEKKEGGRKIAAAYPGKLEVIPADSLALDDSIILRERKERKKGGKRKEGVNG